MVKKLAIIREIFKGDHNAAAARKLRRNEISALSGTLNNKRVMSTFRFGYPHLTLKEEAKVKSDHTKRFPAHDFL